MKRLAVLMMFLALGSLSFANTNTIIENNSDKLTTLDNNEYVGEYTFGGNSPIQNLKVETSGTSLLGKTDTGQSELAATNTKDKYNFKDFGAIVEFKRNSDGKITGAVLTIQGNSFEGSKK